MILNGGRDAEILELSFSFFNSFFKIFYFISFSVQNSLFTHHTPAPHAIYPPYIAGGKVRYTVPQKNGGCFWQFLTCVYSMNQQSYYWAFTTEKWKLIFTQYIHIYLDLNVHSSFIYNGKILKTTPIY